MEKQFVVFKIASSFYCIDIMEVQEVIRENHITVMPNFPSFVEGVINLRGVITPLISINKRLSHQIIEDYEDEFGDVFNVTAPPVKNTQTKNQNQKLIIVNVDSITIALLVDSLDKILTVDESQIQDAEGLGRASRHKMVAGLLHVDGEIYTVLDPKFVLESDEALQLAESLKR